MQNMCSGTGPLQVKNEQEALFLACEMERRAIRVYERGLALSHDPALQAVLAKLQRDEKAHLSKFSKMGNTSLEATDQEQQLLLKSYAAQILFPGGLMQAHREGAFRDIQSLLSFARDSEETAVKCYLEFSSACDRAEVKEAFAAIAAEEQIHFDDLQGQIGSLQE